MNNFTTQDEVNEYRKRQQLAQVARLRGLHKEETVTAWEILGVFVVMILLTIVLPVLAGLLADMVGR